MVASATCSESSVVMSPISARPLRTVDVLHRGSRDSYMHAAQLTATSDRPTCAGTP